MTKMVFDAIGKYIHPRRYRQIVETESVKTLTKEEQDVASENQKHSSVVARVHYQKQRSRDIAAKKGQECMKKLQGEKGEGVEQYIQSKLCLSTGDAAEVSEIQTVEIDNISTNKKDACLLAKETKPSTGSIQMSKRLRLTKEEDDNLKKGLLCHGCGHWTSILNDDTLKFQAVRKADSLKKRAESKFSNLCK